MICSWTSAQYFTSNKKYVVVLFLFFIFTPKIGEKISNLTCAYFSDGLVQPPTYQHPGVHCPQKPPPGIPRVQSFACVDHHGRPGRIRNRSWGIETGRMRGQWWQLVADLCFYPFIASGSTNQHMLWKRTYESMRLFFRRCHVFSTENWKISIYNYIYIHIWYVCSFSSQL